MPDQFPSLTLTAPDTLAAGESVTVKVEARDIHGKKVPHPRITVEVADPTRLQVERVRASNVTLRALGPSGPASFVVKWDRDGDDLAASATITVPGATQPPPDEEEPGGGEEPGGEEPGGEEPAPVPPSPQSIPLAAWHLAPGGGRAVITGGVPFARGALTVPQAERARLFIRGAEVPTAVAVTARHEDGTVRILTLQMEGEFAPDAGETGERLEVLLDPSELAAPLPRRLYMRPDLASLAGSDLTPEQLAQVRGMGIPPAFISHASAAALCATGFFGPLEPASASEPGSVEALLDERFLQRAEAFWLEWNGSPRKPIQYDHPGIFFRAFARFLDSPEAPHFLRWAFSMAARYCAAYGGTANVVTTRPEFTNFDAAGFALALADSAPAAQFLEVNLEKCYSRLADPVGEKMWIFASSQSDMRPVARFFRGALWGWLLGWRTYGATPWRDLYRQGIRKHLDPRTIAEVWRVDAEGRISYVTQSTAGATSNFMLMMPLSVHGEARLHGLIDDETWALWLPHARGCLRFELETQRGWTRREIRDDAGAVVGYGPPVSPGYQYYSAATPNGGPSIEVDLNSFFAFPFALYGAELEEPAFLAEARILLETLTRWPQDGVAGPWMSAPGHETSRKVFGEVYHQGWFIAPFLPPTVPEEEEPGEEEPEEPVGGSVGAAALPRVQVSDQLPSFATTVRVPSGTSLQAAIDQQAPNSLLVLDPQGFYPGTTTLRRFDDGGWRGIATGMDLPAVGTMAPRGGLARLMAHHFTENVIRAEAGASRWLLRGLEVTHDPQATGGAGTLMALGGSGEGQDTRGEQPHDLILHQMHVHGWADRAVHRGILANCGALLVMDTIVEEIHGKGYDTQALACWNGSGPHRHRNVLYSAAGENVMYGGADSMSAEMLPEDITFQRAHFFKPLAWKVTQDPDGTWSGPWTVKNSFELKVGRRVLVEDSVMENNWADGQDGFAVVLKSVNQSGRAPWSETSDVVLRRVAVLNTRNGINMHPNPESNPAVPFARASLQDVFVAAEYRGVQVANLADLLLERAVIEAKGNSAMIFTMNHAARLRVLESFFQTSEYGIAGNGVGFGKAALDARAPGYEWRGNTVVGVGSLPYPTGDGNQYPATAPTPQPAWLAEVLALVRDRR